VAIFSGTGKSNLSFPEIHHVGVTVKTTVTQIYQGQYLRIRQTRLNIDLCLAKPKWRCRVA
jgi:hypothetical protein